MSSGVLPWHASLAPPSAPRCPARSPGTDYEQRLRQQHSKLNPRTGWASLSKTRKKKKGAAAAGEGWSEDEAEGQGAAAGLLQQAGGLLARGAALPPGMLETTRLKDANQVGSSALGGGHKV